MSVSAMVAQFTLANENKSTMPGTKKMMLIQRITLRTR